VWPRSAATSTFDGLISIKAVGDQGATPPGALIPRTCPSCPSSPLGSSSSLLVRQSPAAGKRKPRGGAASQALTWRDLVSLRLDRR
jgi:hypothetical protein